MRVYGVRFREQKYSGTVGEPAISRNRPVVLRRARCCET